MQKSTKSWGLLALCGVLDALISVLILFILSPDGSPAIRDLLQPRSAILPMGVLAVAAGTCAVIAAIWSETRSSSWLMVLHGLACGALGVLVILGATRRVAFRTVALLIVVMAVSMCLYKLARARAQHRQEHGNGAGEWLFGAAGLISLSFAGAFLGFALHWIPLDPSPSSQTFHWLGSYFAVSALYKLGLAFTPPGSLEVTHKAPSPSNI